MQDILSSRDENRMVVQPPGGTLLALPATDAPAVGKAPSKTPRESHGQLTQLSHSQTPWKTSDHRD